MKKKTEKTATVPSVPKKTATVPSVPKKTATVPSVPKKTASNYLDESTKVRSMSIQCYCPPSKWERLLKEAYRYAYILHDKDINEDGSPKKPHYHIVVRFSSPRYRNAVLKLFDLEGLTEDTTVNFQKVNSLGSIFSYLTHDTALAREAGKYVYSADAVVSNDISYFTTIGETVYSSADANVGDYSLNSTFIEDLTSDNYDLRNMSLRYGRDFMKNYRTYEKLRYDILRADEVKHSHSLQKEARTELYSVLTSIDNAERLPSDCEMIAKYIVDNVIKTSAFDYGSSKYQLNDFLDSVRACVLDMVDFYG